MVFLFVCWLVGWHNTILGTHIYVGVEDLAMPTWHSKNVDKLTFE